MKTSTTTTQLFVVMTAIKGGGTAPALVTCDLDDAKYEAGKLRKGFEQKGWKSWAERVSIKAPKTSAAYTAMAEAVDAEIERQGNNSYRTSRLMIAASNLRSAA